MNKNLIIGIVGGILVILIIIAVFALTNKKDPSPENIDTGQQVVLEYWGLWEPASVMQPLIDKYQAQNKNVTVKYTQKTFTQYEENLSTRLTEGSVTGSPAPDLFRIHNTWLSKYQSKLYPAPQNLISTSQYVQDFYPTAQQSFLGTDGQIYAVPLEVDGLVLFYNKQLFAQEGLVEPPPTWDALIETAKKLTKTDANGKITQAGISIGVARNVKHSADILSLLMMQNKGNSEIIDATNTQMSITGDQYISALEFYTDFVKVHKTWSVDLPSDLEMFYTGKLAMMIAPSWATFDILNSNSTVEFATVPTPIVGTKEVYYGHYWGESVSKNSSNPTVAWDFINFLSQEAQLKEFYSNSAQIRAFGEPYSRKTMSGLLINEPYVGAVMKMAPNFQSWKKGEEGYVNESLDTAITAVAENGVEASRALLDAQQRINEKLATSIK
jgi:multiple sugar transport system substrate-binding protein